MGWDGIFRYGTDLPVLEVKRKHVEERGVLVTIIEVLREQVLRAVVRLLDVCVGYGGFFHPGGFVLTVLDKSRDFVIREYRL